MYSPVVYTLFYALLDVCCHLIRNCTLFNSLQGCYAMRHISCSRLSGLKI